MKTFESSNWGSDTLEACRDIVRAKSVGADIIVHEGEFSTEGDHHLSTISNACVDSGVELVLKGVHDPGTVHPHITFVEES